MLLAGMEIFDEILKFASMAVTLFGGAISIGGIIDFGEGKSQQAASKQSEGMTKIVGGGDHCGRRRIPGPTALVTDQRVRINRRIGEIMNGTKVILSCQCGQRIF